jgi:SnoaL-like domain
MSEKLAPELQYLLDRLAIQDCVYRYSRGLDRHDETILAGVFHPDAVDNHGDFVGYIPEFVSWGNALHEASYRGHTHNITCHTAEIDGDVAHAESYVIFVLRHKDGKTVNVGGGRYLDRFERRNGEWRIALRRLIMDWRFVADGSVWAANSGGYEHGRWDHEDASYQRPLELPAADREKLRAKSQAPSR